MGIHRHYRPAEREHEHARRSLSPYSTKAKQVVRRFPIRQIGKPLQVKIALAVMNLLQNELYPRSLSLREPPTLMASAISSHRACLTLSQVAKRSISLWKASLQFFAVVFWERIVSIS